MVLPTGSNKDPKICHVIQNFNLQQPFEHKCDDPPSLWTMSTDRSSLQLQAQGWNNHSLTFLAGVSSRPPQALQVCSGGGDGWLVKAELV